MEINFQNLLNTLEHLEQRLSPARYFLNSDVEILSLFLSIRLEGDPHCLELEDITMTREILQLLISVVRKYNTIKELKIVSCSFENDCEKQVAELLASCEHLHSLELNKIPAADDETMEFLNCMKPFKSPNLRVLRLTECGITEHGLNHLASLLMRENGVRFGELVDVNLTDNRFEANYEPKNFVNLLNCSPRLKVLKLARCQSSLFWLPRALQTSCSHTLTLLDISGNVFNRLHYDEWYNLFAAMTALETINIGHCKGQMFEQVLQAALSGLSVAKQNHTDRAAHLTFSLPNCSLTHVGAHALATYLPKLAQSLRELDLSYLDFGQSTVDVFKALESCVHLERLVIQGPWTTVPSDTQRSAMLSLSSLLSHQNCRLKFLSLANAQLGENLLYFLGELVKFTSLVYLDVCGNNLNDPVGMVLARILSVPTKLRSLKIDNNGFRLETIARLLKSLESTYEGGFKFYIPFADISNHMKENPEMCMELVDRIETFNDRPLPECSPIPWTDLTTTKGSVKFVQRLSDCIRCFYKEIKSQQPSEMLTTTEEDQILRRFDDADHLTELKDEFGRIIKETTGDFLGILRKQLYSKLGSSLKSHVGNLTLCLYESAGRLCPQQSETGTYSLGAATERLQGSVEEAVSTLVDSVLPTIESKLNQLASKVGSDLFETIAGTITEGLNDSLTSLARFCKSNQQDKAGFERHSIKAEWTKLCHSLRNTPRQGYPVHTYWSDSPPSPSPHPPGTKLLPNRGLKILDEKYPVLRPTAPLATGSALSLRSEELDGSAAESVVTGLTPFSGHMHQDVWSTDDQTEEENDSTIRLNADTASNRSAHSPRRKRQTNLIPIQENCPVDLKKAPRSAHSADSVPSQTLGIYAPSVQQQRRQIIMSCRSSPPSVEEKRTAYENRAEHASTSQCLGQHSESTDFSDPCMVRFPRITRISPLETDATFFGDIYYTPRNSQLPFDSRFAIPEVSKDMTSATQASSPLSSSGSPHRVQILAEIKPRASADASTNRTSNSKVSMDIPVPSVSSVTTMNKLEVSSPSLTFASKPRAILRPPIPQRPTVKEGRTIIITRSGSPGATSKDVASTKIQLAASCPTLISRADGQPAETNVPKFVVNQVGSARLPPRPSQPSRDTSCAVKSRVSSNLSTRIMSEDATRKTAGSADANTKIPSVSKPHVQRPRKPRSRSSLLYSPQKFTPPVSRLSTEEDLFKVRRSVEPSSNNHHHQECSRNEKAQLQLHLRSNLKSPVDSDPATVSESDTDVSIGSKRISRLGGVPMPGLVGSEAKATLMEIKQKSRLKQRKISPNVQKPEAPSNTAMSEFQAVRTSLKHTKHGTHK